jgi:antitoxin component YwqK of YwqJK toxin-antitoxin module
MLKEIQKDIGNFIMAMSSNYLNGKEEGYWKYYLDGQLILKCNYINGQIEGWSEDYDRKKNLIRRRFYVNI